MDLLDLQAADEPTWFTLTNPVNGMDLEHDGMPVRMLLNGPDSAVMRAHERKISQRRMTMVGRKGKLDPDAIDIEREALELLLVAVAGWENLFIGGEAVPFSLEKAREILTNPKLRWIGRWIEEKVRDSGNFIGVTPSTPAK